MTENPSVPGPPRDLAMHNDWWVSGWEHVLPRQGFPLTMLIGTASQPGSTGSLDDLLQEILTSLDRLAATTDRDPDDVRLGLTELVASGDAHVQRGREPADTERLEAHHRFRLVMDREHFHRNRVDNSHVRAFQSYWHKELDEFLATHPGALESEWPHEAQCRYELRQLQRNLRPLMIGLADLAGVTEPDRFLGPEPPLLPPPPSAP
ncbi:hypothetical protein GCM10009801_10010 [Streptomyces albiaxialis]|uniref:Uncharacterized protein n=1 Tax=Streptomyces albiaxialis TaxID=329523 RepID=A0ABN2VL69_9ACTN